MATPKLPNHPDNYMVPSAISVWFAPFNDDGSLCPYFDLGNLMDLGLTLTDNFLDHDSARNGLLTRDKRVINQVTGQIKFTLDELVGNNLLLFSRPNVVPSAQVYEVLEQKRFNLVGVTEQIIDPLAVEDNAGDYLDLYWQDDTVDDVLVRSADGAITYVNGVDYTFTQAAGSGSNRTPAKIARTSGGAIADGAEVVVSYNYKRDTTMYVLQSGTILEGRMKIQCLNRIGPLFAYEFYRVNFAVDGDTTINPAEYMKQAFNCEILTDGQGNRGALHLFNRFQKASVLSC